MVYLGVIDQAGFIGGGCNNTLKGNNNVLVGGVCNYIHATSPNPPNGQFNGILSGYCNLIARSMYSSVVGGYCNTNSGYYSSIIGGANNIVSGNYSAILGGSGNNDNGFSYAGVFGCNVNAVASCAFHANGFVAQNLPVAVNNAAYLLLPTGTLYTTVNPPGAYTTRPVYVK